MLFNSTRISRWKETTNKLIAQREHTHTQAVRPEKMEYICRDSAAHIDSIYAYIPVWRLKSRDDETKTKTIKINALSLLRSIQCHRQAETAATVSRTPHIRTREKWIQYWADNRMVMKKCYSFLAYKKSIRTLFASIIISFQFVVWFCQDFTQIIFLRERDNEW